MEDEKYHNLDGFISDTKQTIEIITTIKILNSKKNIIKRIMNINLWTKTKKIKIKINIFLDL